MSSNMPHHRQVTLWGGIFAILTLLASMFLVFMGASPALAEEGSGPVIRVSSTSASPGSDVTVSVTIDDNPGVLGGTLQVSYGDGLTLKSAESGDAFSPLAMTKPGSLTSPCKFSWDGVELSENDIKNGEILSLTFGVADSVQNGATLNIEVSGDTDSFFDGNLDSIDMGYESGTVTVVSYTPGDVNGDTLVNSKDVVLTRREIVGGYDQDITKEAANVNGDEKINSADVIYIRRFITGGYGIKLKPSPVRFPSSGGTVPIPEHIHDFEATPALEPTCTEDGHIAYWRCKTCNKFFSDGFGLNEVREENLTIPASGHTVVKDPAVPPTTTSTGLTEGSHCSVCGTVIKPQEVIPILDADEHIITYDIANGDAYLEQQTINNPNRTSYFEGDSFKLSNLSVAGYRFLGWYDGAGDDSTKITRIEATSNEDYELYAHWQIISYVVQYESSGLDRDALDVTSSTYTVDKGLVLPIPRLSNYEFVCYTDEAGTFYENQLPKGMTGNKVLTAHWTSERNKTITKTNLDEPFLINDEEDHLFLAAYEIGRIENVPRYVIKDFGYISGTGVTRSATETYEEETAESTMTSLANTVAKATTESSSWTLSKDWNNVVSIDEEWCEQNGYTHEEAETLGKSSSSNWNTSSNNYGSDTTVHSTTKSNGWNHEVATNQESSTKIAAGMKAELKAPGFGSAGMNLDVEEGFKTGGSESGGNTRENIKFDNTEKVSGWNTSNSYGGSTTASQSNTVSDTLSHMVSQKKGYGESYAIGGGESSTQGLVQGVTDTNSYSASTTYDTTKKSSVTRSWTTASTKPGYHRWIIAGTAHVFGVVGYDLRTNTFFTYTYTMMDDETHEFEDYSYTSDSYNDNENGVISFEVPYDDITKFVSEHICYTDGLRMDPQTGKVMQYTGTAQDVIIPEYYNAGQGDIIKITGLDAHAFAGNTNITGVFLSDFITDIPAGSVEGSNIPVGSFAGCTNMDFCIGTGVKTIGERAFAGCTKIPSAILSRSITALGKNAFDGHESLTVDAANAEVAIMATQSGVQNLHLDVAFPDIDGNAPTTIMNGVTLTIPNTMNHFEITGGNLTFKNLKIDSKATNKTTINKLHIVSDSSFPLKIASPELVLNQSTISSTGLALLLTADSTNIGLRGTSTITSSGSYAVLSKNINAYETNADVVGKLIVQPEIMICGTLSGSNLIETRYTSIDSATYNNMLNPYTLTFDTNGGTCDPQSKEVYNGEVLGELPVPTKDYHTFSGWFFNDTAVTPDTVLPISNGHTLTAHWTENGVTDWVKASDAPADAQIVNRKWTYKQSFYRQDPASYTYYRWCSNYDGIWNQDSRWVNNSSCYHEITVPSPIQANPHKFADQGGNPGGICGPYGNCEHKREGQSYWWLKQVNYVQVLDHVENKESTVQPSGSNISNVVEWVTYRPRTNG